MTITPQQANELNESDREEVQELELKIDKVILDQFDGSPVSVNVRHSNDKVRREIERIYGKAGWSVKYESYQHDGDYFKFSPKKSRGSGQ